MSTDPMTAAATPVKPSVGGILKNGALAGGVAIILNAILYFIGVPLGAFPQEILTPMGVPLTLGPVAGMTLFGAIGGTVAYLVLTRFLAKPLADRIFLILAVAVLIFMAFSPLNLPGAPMMQVIFLEIMHLVAGIPLMIQLPRSV